MSLDLAGRNENMDLAAHVRSYENFAVFMKHSIAALAIAPIGMAAYLT